MSTLAELKGSPGTKINLLCSSGLYPKIAVSLYSQPHYSWVWSRKSWLCLTEAVSEEAKSYKSLLQGRTWQSCLILPRCPCILSNVHLTSSEISEQCCKESSLHIILSASLLHDIVVVSEIKPM